MGGGREGGWVTEADSDARSFFIIFKPPWSNLTLETVPSKSIRGSAFSLFPPSPSFPFFLSRRAPYIARDESPANQVDSFHPAYLTRVFNIDVVFYATLPTFSIHRGTRVQQKYQSNDSIVFFFLPLSLSFFFRRSS